MSKDGSVIEDQIQRATIFQWNARGLKTRLSDFRQFIQKYRFPILAICESKLCTDFRLSGYEVFHSARTSGPARVMVAVRKELTYVSYDVQQHPDNEYVCVTVQHGKCKFSVIAAYIPPGARFEEKRLEDLLNNCPPPHIMTGDFNAHHPVWGSLHMNTRGRCLADLAAAHHLSVLNDGSPTYLRGTTCSSCLDVTFVTNTILSSAGWFTDIETHGSDHIPTYIIISSFQGTRNRNTVQQTNWDTYKDSMEQACENTTNLSEFESAILGSRKAATKTYNLSSKQSAIDSEYERLRAIRRRAERKVRRTKDPNDLRDSRKAQRHTRRHLQKLGWRRWKSVCASMDPKKPLTNVWKIARGLKTPPQQLRPFKALALHKQCSEKCIAEEYCNMLTSSSNNLQLGSKANTVIPPPTNVRMNDPFSMQEMEAALGSSNAKSSPGPDGVRYSDLIHLGSEAKARLLAFFNISWENGLVPPTWKKSRIVPLLKPGKSMLDISSYRPIALASCLGKLMEKMILFRMEWYLEQNGHYPNIMSGFRRGRNSIDSVIDLVTSVEQSKSEGRICAAVFLDIKSAFDSITHNAIFESLEELGLGGHIYRWLTSYLDGRYIYISTEAGDTRLFPVTRGVPQGGVLSPTLFQLPLISLVKKLPNTIHASLYADDICIWASGITRLHVKARLQRTLDILHHYLTHRGLHISTSKSAAIAFTRRSMNNYPLTICREEIPFVKKHLFLGVVVDRGLTWTPHIQHLTKKLSAFVLLARFISGTTWGATVPALLRLYQAIFVGILRYSLPVFNGTCKTNMKVLQSLQARALRCCLGLPRSASTPGTIAESRQFPTCVLQIQETLRIHLRHLTRHKKHHLADIMSSRPSSNYARVLTMYQQEFPSKFLAPGITAAPPWTIPPPLISLDIPGIQKKRNIPQAVLYQHTMSVIYGAHISRTHVFTDGSTCEMSSTAAAVFPTRDKTIKHKLSHKTSSTASELIAIQEAVRYVERQQPQTWTIFTDSKASLKILQSAMVHSGYQELGLSIMLLLNRCREKGHDLRLQWIPSHCGISGNEAADAAAKSAHKYVRTLKIPYFKSDANSTVRNMAKRLTSHLWADPEYHHARLYALDPHMTFKYPPRLPRRSQAVLHRLRLGVAFTRYFLHRIKRRDSPNCPVCDVQETADHLICECAVYAVEREDLHRTIQRLDDRPFSCDKVLGSWQCAEHSVKATKALVQFLEDTRLMQSL